MIRILFVDDEPELLNGLRDALRRHRKEWQMVFVQSGAAALEQLEREPFDVIATDLRMPGMDGAELLRRVQAQHPRVVRVVFSGRTDHESARRTVLTAHQFVAKPCDVAVLAEVIQRSCSLNSLLLDDVLRGIVGQMGQLPAVPSVVIALNEVLARPSSSSVDVARIIEQDPALCAKVLQLVNSSFFGLARRMTEIGSAVAYLGIDVLRSLTMTVQVFEFAKDHPRIPGFAIESEQAHALRAARIARHIGAGHGVNHDAFMAGMLHDVGRLILAQRAPERFAEALEAARLTGRPLFEAEEDTFGVTHAEIGAYLLGLWGLPFPIVEATAFHHYPGRVEQNTLDLVGIVHVAQGLARELGQVDGTQWIGSEPMDAEYLEAMSVAPELPDLRRSAAHLFESRESSW